MQKLCSKKEQSHKPFPTQLTNDSKQSSSIHYRVIKIFGLLLCGRAIFPEDIPEAATGESTVQMLQGTPVFRDANIIGWPANLSTTMEWR